MEKFNVIKGGSKFYGENSFLWFILAGIPYLLLAWLPFFLYGFYKYHKEIQNWTMEKLEITIAFLWFLLILSSSSHKEER